MLCSTESSCQRKALFILNNNYKKNSKLENNFTKINDLKTKFEQFDFQIHLGLNLLNEEIDLFIEQFSLKLNPNDLIFIYYYGYGFDFDNQFYLIGINDEILNDTQLIKYECTHLNTIFDIFNKINSLTIVYLFDFVNLNSIDFTKHFQSISLLNNQLLFMILIDHSQQLTNNSKTKNLTLFFHHLFEYIDEKYLSINQIFDMIEEEILNYSNRQIIPWKKSLIKNNLYLNSQIQLDINEKRNYLINNIKLFKTPSETYLDLRNKQIKDSEIKILLEEFLYKNSLKKLCLDQNQITSIGLFIFSSYFNSNQSHTLEKLYLNDNQISDIGIKYLSNALKQNRTLKILSLQKNHLTDISIEYLLNFLNDNQTLISLSLDFNRISDKGIDLLFSNSSKLNLKYLGLSNNVLITDLAFLSIQNFILHNQTIEDITLFNCHLSKLTQIKIQKLAKTKKNFSICLLNWNE